MASIKIDGTDYRWVIFYRSLVGRWFLVGNWCVPVGAVVQVYL